MSLWFITLRTWLHIKSFLYSAWHLHADLSTESKDSVAWSNLVTGSQLISASLSRDFLRIFSDAQPPQRLCSVVDAIHFVSVLAFEDKAKIVLIGSGFNLTRLV